MPTPAVNHPVHAIRSLDLASIDAVGFDLDHTLALYDDQAVNLLAAEETVDTLRIRGYSPGDLPFEIMSTVARGLSMDLRHGNVLKIGADGQVKLARHGTKWLSDRDIAIGYGAYDPADESATWHVHSTFDTPTLWFFSALGPGIRDAADAAYAAQLLRDIRASLDDSHTRGELKTHIARDMPRFVTPAGSLIAGLEHWKQEGKRLFVVTNSDRRFATRVLDHVMGSRWRRVFDIVVTDAGKPRFFTGPSSPPPALATRRNDTLVLDHGSASLVESLLGISGEHILYAGDNARADVIPARIRGWRTLQVVAELSAAREETPWARALDHDGAPTWFAKVIRDHADAACARIDALLAIDPRAQLAPDAPFYTRIAGPSPTTRPGNVP